jgi:fibronectin-binding autotransporter adhesin
VLTSTAAIAAQSGSSSAILDSANGLTKTTSGTITLAAVNSYTGNTRVNAGTLVTAHLGALGFGGSVGLNRTPGSTSVATGATLDLDGQGITEPITLNGGTLTNGSATAASITSGVKGVGFVAASSPISSDAAIVYSSGGGSGAAATVLLGLTQSSLSLNNSGSGYTVAPTVTISGGGGVGATAVATLTGDQVTGITLMNPGTGYTSAPTINFSGGGGGSGASASGVNDQFALVGIQQTSAGSGYTSAPTANFTATAGSATLGTPVVASVALASTSSVGGTGDISIATAIGGAGGLTKIGTDTLTLSAANTYSGNTNVNAGTLNVDSAGSIASANVTVASGATLNVNGQVASTATVNANGSTNFGGNTAATVLTRTLGTLNVGAGVTVVQSPSSFPFTPAVLQPTTLTFADSTAKLDVGNNELVTTDSLSNISAAIVSGQIFTSSAGGALGSLDLGGGQVEVRFTLLGDTNLDGKVDVTDLGNLASNYGATAGATWAQGDSTYNGAVDVSDLGNLASNYGGQLAAGPSFGGSAEPAQMVASSLATAAVPEPMSLGLTGLGVIALLPRRRRR